MPNNPDIPSWQRLVSTSKVMSLATCGIEGAWSAPVYYLFAHRKFYFFSNPEARHIQMGQDQRTGASIFLDHPDITRLQGIQMSGIIRKCPLDARSLGVATTYCTQFNIKGGAGNILEFFALKFHASLFFFQPDRVYYMDNRKGFGSREEIQL